jgi:hypothetical protein
MALSKSTLFSEAWNTFYYLISGNITDPSARSKKWVSAGFPDVRNRTEGLTAAYFPWVVINSIEPTSKVITHGNSNNQVDFDIRVDVWATNSNHLDSVADDIYDAVSANRNVLIGSGITNINLASTDTDIIDLQNIVLKNKGLTFSGRYVHTV